MDHKKYLTDFFPIGVKYGQHRDMQEKYWDMDFANMRDCGIDALRVHAFWSVLEPREGCFDFGQYDRITKKAGEYGLKILFTLYTMASPEWIFHKHADSRFISAKGTVWNSNQHPDNSQGGWPGLCFDSQPFRGTLENFVKAFVEHFKGNDNVLAIDIWHEPAEEAGTHYCENDWQETQMCYCEHSIHGFKQWLREKYGTLDTLNQVWTRHYNSWDEVDAPRNYGTYTDWLDWKTYRLDAMTDAVRWLGSIVKKYDSGRAAAVHTGILEFGHPITHSDDHFRLADTTDMFGCSLYDAVNADIAGFTGDLMRSACHNGAFWVGETGTGSGPIFLMLGSKPEEFHCFARTLTPVEITKLVWSNIARGAKGIFYWAWRPDISTMETLSLGFTERNGRLTGRTGALKAFTTVLRENRSSLANAFAPDSDVCILYNMDAMIIEGIASVGATASGGVDLKGTHYKDMLSFIGLYRLCMKNGIQPDFIDKKGLLTDGLKKYKMLVLPYSIMVDDQIADAVKDYVGQGGIVISDAMLGFFTNDGWGSEVCPPHGLDDVFGLDVSSDYVLINNCDVRMIDPCGVKSTECCDTAYTESCGANDGDQVFKNAGCFIRERLYLKADAGVTAVYEDGLPSVITHKYGKGKTVYIGTMFFANAVREGLAATDPVFKYLLRLAGYTPDKSIENVDVNALVEVRRLNNDSESFIFVFNHEKYLIKPEICVENVDEGRAVELLGGDTQFYFKAGNVSLKPEMEPYGVRIYKIMKNK